ncbi:MAG TPA: hypothetical protein VK588_00600 [Chitinophagaceae bacterium]|nr:hypothetical protein [Chitinophagaceae bacterium]
MEKLKELWSNIRDRLTNPLVFSFLCSWIVFNWKIVIALLWYDTSQIQKAGFTTIFDFVSKTINDQDSFWHPLFFAVGYTVFMPLVKNLIRALYSWMSKWGENWNLKIMRGGKIPIEKFFRLRDDYDKRTTLLESIISKETQLTTEYNSVKTELLEAQSSENNLKQQLIEQNTTASRSKDVTLLNGHWTNSFSDSVDTNFRGSEQVYIEHGNYFIIDTFGGRKLVFQIKNFFFDQSTKAVFFIKERVGQEKPFIATEARGQLRFNANHLTFEHSGLLVGLENGTTNIKYERSESISTEGK